MHPRAAELIAVLGLVAHPEGGYFGEVFRSSSQVDPLDGRDRRAAVTTIYFLLAEGQTSAWHRVQSDEAWHYYEGDPLQLTWRSPIDSSQTDRILGPVNGEQSPVAVVPAGCWQTARPLGAYTLVGCTVGPGFEYEDFEMRDPDDRPAAT